METTTEEDLKFWYLTSECADPQISPDIWFEDADVARRICGRCPVRDACLDYAMKTEEESGDRLLGVWGGLSPIQRQRLRDNPSALSQMRRVRSKTKLRGLPSMRPTPARPAIPRMREVQLELIAL